MEIMELKVRIAVKSPLHLGSGGADVLIDADVVHDKYGVPYFPAKRLKGLLYESAKEVLEISELSAMPLFNEAELNTLFQHGTLGDTQIILHNFYLADYPEMARSWEYIQGSYGNIITSQDVLDEYTSIRYQTSIDKETGTARDTSLHNMRVVEAGLTFEGMVKLVGDNRRALPIFALACQNLKYAGGKRNRGFGHIECSFDGMEDIVRGAFDML